ncbi:MAG: hypothetical protein U5L45_02255 [Saprospiraceae bacterium]|nr:hypothetical protein [Saprospiraceae bacterium]
MLKRVKGFDFSAAPKNQTHHLPRASEASAVSRYHFYSPPCA